LGLVNLDENISKYYKEYICPSKFSIECGSEESNITYNGTTYRCQKSPDFKKYYALIPIPEENRLISLKMLLSHYGGIEFYTNGFTDPVPPNDIKNNP
jgi:CubicO group peptidase (beta-lactamase class C family)